MPSNARASDRPRGPFLVGVDIGGTFTDCVVLDRDGRITATKSSSTPGDFAEGMLNAMRVAAERIGRVARATEIAPEYVDVAVKRFQQNFPEVPVTLVSTGQTFSAVASERLGGAA